MSAIRATVRGMGTRELRKKMRRQGFEKANAKVNSFAPLLPKVERRPAPSKESIRDLVDDAHEAFWASGGEITKCPPGKPQ